MAKVDKAWLVLLLGVVACGKSTTSPDPAPAPSRPPTTHPELDARLVEPAPPEVPVAPATTPGNPTPSCLSPSAVMTGIEVRAKETRACFDENSDDKPDHCVRWQRGTGAVLGIDTLFDVEATDATPTPAEFHIQSSAHDDNRLELTDEIAEICPPDRACVRIKPLLADQESIQELATDDPYRAAVVSIKSAADEHWRLEFWDLQSGRLRARQPLKLLPDVSHEVSLRMSSGVVLALVTTNDGAHGLVFGVDGTPRGAFAGGAHALNVTGAAETAGVYVIADVPEAGPGVIYVTSVSTGALLAKLPVPHAETLTLKALGNLVVAASQGDQLRFDVIDTRTRTAKTFQVPAC